jgi:uncharacterized protein YbjT (DUF2867 family)
VAEQIMTMVVVFGGGGFLGRRLVHRLIAERMAVRVAVRHPDRARIDLRALGFDRVAVVPADVRDQTSVAAAIAGTDAVVNTVSAYVERSVVTFEAVHVRGAETVAREASAAGITRLVLVSGIGADPDSSSPYIRARGRVRTDGSADVPWSYDRPPGRHVRPGRRIVQDARRACSTAAGTAAHRRRHTRLQPVFVEDVAEAIANILTDPATVGRTYELACREVYTLRELVQMTLRLMSKRRLSYRFPLRWPRSRRGCSSSCQTHHSPPAKLIFSRRIMSRAVPFPVCKSSRFNRKQSRRWCRRTLALGHPDRNNQFSEIDDQLCSHFSLRGFRPPGTRAWGRGLSPTWPPD